jgi:hypothetical protein
VKVSVAKDGTLEIVPDHPDPALGRIALMDALGSEDLDFLTGIINQLGNVVSLGGVVSGGRLNFLLSIVKGVGPIDQVEAMLAAQMAVTHQAVMTFARRLATVETIPQQDSAERAFNKLGRTFAAQVEAIPFDRRAAGDGSARQCQ